MKFRFAIAFILLVSGFAAFAQSVAGLGAISGTVRDASGGSVPDAQVIVSNASKGIHRELTTTASGDFTVPSLVPAAGYTVTVTKEGFTKWVADNVQVLVGQNVGLEVTLTI